ncbi:MAG: hypothetical protein FWC45_04420 [Treponema sp.]|nr:hypothetical protein [Treponema sp.]
MKIRACCAMIALFFALSFTGCDAFFSTSLGSPRKYDASKIDVNAGNIADWLKASVGNSDLASAVTEAILRELGKVTDPAEKAALLQGGVSLAVESSGLGESILTRGSELLQNLDNIDDTVVTDLLKNIQNDFISSGGVQAAENIAQMVNKSITTDANGIPVFDKTYADLAQPGDVAEAILVLVMGELGSKSITDQNTWSDLTTLTNGLDIIKDSDPPQVKVTDSSSVSPTSLALAAYINLIAGNPDKFMGNPLASTINDAFFSKS